MPNQILLIGPSNDRELLAVQSHLESKHIKTELWDSNDWPGRYPFELYTGRNSQQIGTNGTSLDEIAAVFIRGLNINPKLPRFDEELKQRPFALINLLDEARSLFYSGLEVMESRGVTVVNPLATVSIHSLKPMQMNLFQRAGLPVPDTLVTSDADAVRNFFQQCNGDVIYKPLGGGGYVRELEPTDLADDRLALLGNSPVMFQQRCYGDNLRLYIIDGQLVGAGRIVTKALDYRIADHGVEQLEIDPQIIEAAIRATEILGLIFAGVDVIANDDGFVILEANPSPMFVEFDKRAGTQVAASLAGYLQRCCISSYSDVV